MEYGHGDKAKLKGNVKASDSTGERGGAKKGIPGGKAESTAGKEESYSGGRHSGTCYTHTRANYGK